MIDAKKNPIEEARGPEQFAMGSDAEGNVEVLTFAEYQKRLTNRNAQEEVDDVRRPD